MIVDMILQDEIMAGNMEGDGNAVTVSIIAHIAL